MLPGFICTHVTDEKHPVLLAAHDCPAYEEDSGWCLTCGAAEGHPDSELKIVNLDRYFGSLPDIEDLRESVPEGFRAWRSAAGQPWVIEPLPPDEQAA